MKQSLLLTSQLFPNFLISVIFSFRALDSLINYYFFMKSVFEKALLSLLFYTQNDSLSLMIFFFKALSLYSFPPFYGRAVRAYYLQLSTGFVS